MSSHKIRPRWDWERIYDRRISASDYTDEMMSEILACLGRSDISAAEFATLRDEIADAENHHLWVRDNMDRRPTPGQMREALEPIRSHLDQALTSLRELDEDSRMYIDLAASGSDVASPLIVALENDDEEMQRMVNANEIVGERIDAVDALLGDVDAALKRLPTPQRGQPPELAYEQYIGRLANIFEKCSDMRAAVRSEYDGHAGPFVDFVLACERPIEDKQDAEAPVDGNDNDLPQEDRHRLNVGQRVRRALESRQSKRQVQSGEQ